MKRTIAISVISLLFGCTYAAHRAGAQELPQAETEGNLGHSSTDPLPGEADLSPLEAAKLQYQAAEQRASRLAIELLKQAAEKGPNAIASDRQALREKLKPLVEENFNARQRLQQEELKALRRRLAEIERAIEDRAAHKEAIINSRVGALADSAANEIARTPGETTHGDQREKVAPLRNQFQREGANGESIPLGVSPPPPVGPPVALPDAPPGMEARVRYVQVQIEKNGAVMTVARPVVEFVQVGQASAARVDDAAAATNPASPNAPPGPTDAAASVSEAFDLDTRQRLALLDLLAAEEEYVAAEKELIRARKMNDQGVMADSEFSSHEKDLRHAVTELRRAKVKLNGLAAQRADLQAAAESAVADANAEVERAAAKLKGAETSVAAVEGAKTHFEAGIEAAQTKLAFQTKKLNRLNELAKVEKAIDLKLVDEAEEQKLAAEAALVSAKSAALTADANVESAKAAVEEARAELHIAEARRRAAQARLDRLMRQTPRVDVDPLKPGAGSSEAEKSLE